QLDRRPVARGRHGRLRHALPLPSQRLARVRQRGFAAAASADRLRGERGVARCARDSGGRARGTARPSRRGEGRGPHDRDRRRGRSLRRRAELRDLVGRAGRRGVGAGACSRRARTVRDGEAKRAEPHVIEAAVIGRVGIDLYPNELSTPLRRVRTYTRFVGGFAGNVTTGLARLGVRVAILSRVGDEGHGEFVRDWLAREGVDVRFLRTDSYWQTPPTFCEVW